MATSDYLDKSVRIYPFTQFTQSTVAAFSTQFNTDWSSRLGQTVQLLSTTAQPLRAIFIVPSSGPTLYINAGIARTPTDGVLNSTTTVTSATASFSTSDVGAAITGTGIPTSTTIVSVTSATSVVLSHAATATSTGVSITITPVGGDFVGFSPWNGWQVVPAWNMSNVYTATAN
jgi:hypothetical protein